MHPGGNVEYGLPVTCNEIDALRRDLPIFEAMQYHAAVERSNPGMKQAKVLKIDLLPGKDGSDLRFHRFAIRHGLKALGPYLGAAPMPPEAAQGNVQS